MISIGIHSVLYTLFSTCTSKSIRNVMEEKGVKKIETWGHHREIQQTNPRVIFTFYPP